MDSIPTYLSPVSIIPGGCPQFLDFALPEAALGRMRRYFREEKRQEVGPVSGLASGEGTGAVLSRYTHHLRCLQAVENGFVDQLTDAPAEPDYEMDAKRVIDTWQDTWLPLPFLRTLDQQWKDGRRKFEKGPSNWARVRVTRSRNQPGMLRIVLVFDTNVEPRPDSGEEFHALSPQDVTAHGHFMLADHVRDNSWFLNAAWVDTWISDAYSAWRQKNHRGRGHWQEDSPYILEHLASYMTLLAIIARAMGDFGVIVINPDRDMPVDVDLIVDIGNSRTTGILVETMPQRMTNLNDSYLLELRDLSQPEYIHAEPFETRVEFVDASFGNDALSRRSGRQTPAFAWPSAVRVGPEAARLATQAVCAEGTTGMSSPKRYLWDERPWQQSWRFNTGGNAEPMVSRGLFARQLNPQGTPLACFGTPMFKKSAALRKQKAEPIFESLFTRSSLMLFMMGEIITQALVTVNSPATRSRRELPNLPRRLRRLIFTVPTAMPVAEKRIFRRWVTWAVQVVWQALGWKQWYLPEQERKKQGGEYRISPDVRCDWDEASCSQLVLLYNELTVKQHGDAHHLFRLLGKPRGEYGDRPCVRMASLDIGGGTTDLSITTFELASGEGETAHIVPHTEFRDGFNIAGDEVVREVVVNHVIPAIGEHLTRLGIAEPRLILQQFFGRDMIGMSQEDRNTRGRLVRQIAVPVALGLLSACETEARDRNGIELLIGDFFEPDPLIGGEGERTGEAEASANGANADSGRSPENGEAGKKPWPGTKLSPRPQPATLRAVAAMVARHYPQAGDFDLLEVPIRIRPGAVEATIRTTLGPTLATLCEMVHLHDCDILLLTGRPSTWSGVVAPVLAKLPVPPDRIIPMRQYHVGRWYPFADSLGRIADPKTTVVVGAILCALAEGHLEGFSFESRALRLTSTARYVGELDINGQLRRPKVWFTVDVDREEGTESSRKVAFSGPLSIGYRQLDAERWPTTRYHLLTFADEQARNRASGHLPYTVEIRLRVDDVWYGVREDAAGPDDERSQRGEGEFSIDSILDNQGRSVPRSDLEIHLQTLKLDEGYWLDTGIVSDAG